MKRVLCLILSLFLIIGLLPTFSVMAENGISPSIHTENLIETFNSDFKQTFIKEDDGVIGIPVTLTTFRREATESSGLVVLYVVGHCQERIGTTPDEEIIEEFLNDGHFVVVLDYLNNPKAIGTALTKSAQTINAVEIYSAHKYIDKYNIYISHTVPAGCKVARNIYYYSLDTMAPYGVNEYIVETYNMYYAGKYKDKNGNYLKEATTLEECLKKDGTPINCDLFLHMVYPSEPKTTVPVFCIASSMETPEMETSTTQNFYFTNALFNGYASVIYDHEYIPMSRDDHFGYLDARFSLASYTANRVHSAAIRRIRYLQDQYGYNADYITAMGFSKSGLGVGILSNVNHEEMGEYATLDAYCPEGKSPLESPEEQPWLYYEGTDERISSNLTVAYSGAGAAICQAREFCITENCVPIASSIGDIDDTAGFKYHIPQAQNYLDNMNIESLFLSLEGVAHRTPNIYSEIKEADLFEVTFDFLDNHIRAAYREEAPKALWILPKANSYYDEFEGPIEIKFSRAMDPDSIKNGGVKITRLADNLVIGGEWTTLHGNTTFHFNSSLIIPGSDYRIEITDKATASDGVALKETYSKSFTVAGDEFLKASYNSTTNPYSNDTLSVSPNEFGGYTSDITFSRRSGYSDVVKALLILGRTNDQNARLLVKCNNFTLAHPVDSDVEVINVTDYVKRATGQNISFNLSSVSKSDKTISYDFEDGVLSNVKYSLGGTGRPTVALVKDGYNSNYCLSITGRNTDSRIRFTASVGSSKLTQNDLGQTLKISYNVKASKGTSISNALYVQSGKPYTGFGAVTKYIEGNTWTNITCKISITQDMIDNNTTCFGINPLQDSDIYIDDLSIEYDAGVTEFASIYKAESTNSYTAPTLVIFTSNNFELYPINAANVKSGELSNDITDAFPLAIDGKAEGKIENTKKGYLKMPIDSIDTDTDVMLNFTADTTGKKDISVYGIIEDDSRFAENWSNISWNDAFANDISDYSVDTNKVYGGKPLSTVNGTLSSNHSINVTDYVKQMKASGYKSVTFIFVSNINDDRESEDFEYINQFTSYTSYSLTGFDQGITTDPENANNKVFYFDKSGGDGSGGTVNGYYQCISLSGYLGTNGRWTTADIGTTYTVSFKQYGVTSGLNAGIFGCINERSALSYKSIPGVTRSVKSVDGTNATSLTPNKWLEVTYTFTVTQEYVDTYPNATYVVIGSGWPVTRTYIDDIKIEKKVGNTSIDLTNTPPTLSNGADTYAYSLAATIDGQTPDAVLPSDTNLPLSKTASSELEGLSKVYLGFYTSNFIRFDSTGLSINVTPSSNTTKLLIYPLLTDVDFSNITWNNAVANKNDNSISTDLIFGGAPIEVPVNGEGTYTANISDFATAKRDAANLYFIITAADGEEETIINDVMIKISGKAGSSAQSKASLTVQSVNSGKIMLTAYSEYSTHKNVESVSFYVDNIKIETPAIKKGDSYHLYTDLDFGVHNAYAEFCYSDGEIAVTDLIDVTVNPSGDVNGDGNVDAADLALLKKVIAKITPIDADEVKYPNVDNEAGEPNAADLALLKKIIAKLV